MSGLLSSTTESRDAVQSAAPSSASASGRQTASFATGMPQSSDLAAREAGHPNVSALGTGGNVFGLMTLGVQYSSNGPGFQGTYESSATFNLNIASLRGQPLQIGLVNPVVTGNFASLQLTIVKDGQTIESDFFSP